MTNNTKAVMMGLAVGFVLFFGNVFHNANSRSAAPQPGSVTVRPIRTNDGASHMTFSLGLGIGGGLAAFWVARRLFAKRDEG